MSRPIAYMMSGDNHCPYLLVSLYTLRQHWDGPIIVYSWPESIRVVRQIARDPRLGISVVPWNPEYRGKNSQFASKILMAKSVEAETVLYLDADTIIRANPTPLFEAAHEYGFAATRFNDWTTAGKIIKGRIRRLEPFGPIDAGLIIQTLAFTWPSVNGGVFACNPRSEVLPLWHKWTMIAKTIFIADETVLHVLQPKYIPEKKMTVVEGWNTSPKHGNADEANILHGHGDCFLRPHKSGHAVKTWMALWNTCLEENIGDCQEWSGSIDYKWMNKCLKQIRTGEFSLDDATIEKANRL